MTNPQVLALVVGFGVACLARATAAQDPPTGSQAALDPTVLSRLDTALEQAVADREVSGVIGLIHHRGTRAYFKAFGWQDIETHKPLEKDAIFRLQSMTKPVVVATALAHAGTRGSGQRSAGKLTEKPTLFLGGQGLVGSAEDYERFCRMLMNRGELDGVRVLAPETVDLMFENHVAPAVGRRYGLGGAVDGTGGYAWGGANGTQFCVDRTNRLFGVFMVQTHRYRAPTYGVFKSLASEACGLVASAGQPGAPGTSNASRGRARTFSQRDTNKDGKLDHDEIPAALFNRLDAGKDGFVTEAELLAIWKR